jgi:hypothetical protein
VSELPVPAPTPATPPPEIPPPRTLVCANCGAQLTGEYCAACGQRHEPHIHSVAHFAGEAFESLTHADSRLWRTIGYLLAKPGLLTRHFFAGQRASYLPPFRLYLVISVAFFILGPSDDTRVAIRDSETLEFEQKAPVDAKERAILDTNEKDGYDTFTIQGLADFCQQFEGLEDSDNVFRNNIRENCRQLAKGDGRELGRRFLHNLPRAMFIFLPALAFVMWLLYWRPKRYYVEHLLFLVHNHAFVFLACSIVIVLGRIPFVGDYIWLAWVLGGLYALWYVYRAMRVVYAQGRALTLSKYVTLLITYVLTMNVMFLLTLLYAAMTI